VQKCLQNFAEQKTNAARTLNWPAAAALLLFLFLLSESADRTAAAVAMRGSSSSRCLSRAPLLKHAQDGERNIFYVLKLMHISHLVSILGDLF
jgi:hypothetical protein